MSTAAKTKKAKLSKASGRTIDEALDMALNADEREIKVHITCRIDSDIYMELKRRADEGAGDGKYQKYMNDCLREHLFNSQIREDKTVVQFEQNMLEFMRALQEKGFEIQRKARSSSSLLKTDRDYFIELPKEDFNFVSVSDAFPTKMASRGTRKVSVGR